MTPLQYYSRDDIQEAIRELAKDREVTVMFSDGHFGKRPDVLQFKGDVSELARQGATSFHISEERWENPLDISTGMTKKQLDELRKGWDLVLDIDTPHWDYAKLTAYLLYEALRFFDIKSISIKFSGNKGFHLAVPFEAFPEEVNGVRTKGLFPESLRVIAAYLQEMIKEHLAAKILEKAKIEDICEIAGKKKEELMKDGKFNPFAIIDIDTVLISSRHLFRSAYSLHEKSGLASIPVMPSEVLSFDKENAKPELVRANLKFLERESVIQGEAKQLIIQAFDWESRRKGRDDMKEIVEKKKEFQVPTTAIKEEFFPPCMQKILAGSLLDGRKRSLFILLNFLKKMGWDNESIKKSVSEWNKKNEPLKEGYVQSQISWHIKQKEIILPPNCDNKMYYQDLRLCDGKQFCMKFKNPVNFAVKMAILKGSNKKE